MRLFCLMFLAFLFTVNANSQSTQSTDSTKYVYPKGMTTDTFVVAAIIDKRLSLKELIQREKTLKTKLTYEYFYVVVESFIFPTTDGKDQKVPNKQNIYSVNWMPVDLTKFILLDIKEIK